MFNWLFSGYQKARCDDTTSDTFRININPAGMAYFNAILEQSTHNDVEALIKEGLRVLHTVYDQSAKTGKEVICRVEKGRIQMYVSSDGDDGEPISVPEETEGTNIITFVRKAA